MRVLVVDDEPQPAEALAMNLRARRHEVSTAASGAAALRAAQQHPPDRDFVVHGLARETWSSVGLDARGSGWFHRLARATLIQ